MARVLLAEDERLGRQVAIKQMHSSAPEDSARRLQREARIGAALSHPNLVSVFDIETEDESVLIVMEYVEGETLRDALARGPLESERALAVVRDIAAALDHVHAQGVVHRDVKPANVLIGRDGAKLADLGIATAAEATRITVSGTVLGTAAYMAPEQLEGERAGPGGGRLLARGRGVRGAVRAQGARGRDPDGDRPPRGHRAAARPARRLAGRAGRRGRRRSSAAWRRSPRIAPRSAGELAELLERGLGRGDRPHAPRGRGRAGGRPRGCRSRRSALALALVGGAACRALGGDDERSRGRLRAPRSRTARPRSRPEAEAPRAKRPAAPATPAPKPAADPAALNEQGFQLMNQGRYDEAIPVLQRAVDAADPGDLTYAYALYNLGRSLRLAGRADEAVPVLERRAKIHNQQKAW